MKLPFQGEMKSKLQGKNKNKIEARYAEMKQKMNSLNIKCYNIILRIGYLES